MKKRILLIFGLSLLLVGCVNRQPINQNPTQDIVENSNQDNTETKVDNNETQSEEDYVINTFKEHGVHLSKDDFQVKHQGRKRVVMMKNHHGKKHKKHHTMHKMIFTNENGEFKPHHLMIDNHTYYGSDD